MATFVALINFTESGMRDIDQSPRRADAFIAQARSVGIDIKSLYWTTGSHDGVLIFDAPDDGSAAGLLLSLARAGNVRTETLRAFDRTEFETVLSKMT